LEPMRNRLERKLSFADDSKETAIHRARFFKPFLWPPPGLWFPHQNKSSEPAPERLRGRHDRQSSKVSSLRRRAL